MFTAWESPEAVFQILKRAFSRHALRHHRHRRLPHARPGAGHPVAATRPRGATRRPQRRLFADGRFYHPDGRARFLFEDPRPTPEPPGGDFPFQLLTGRGSAAQWHTQTRTAKSDVLRKLAPKDPYVEIHPADATALGLSARSVGGRRITPRPAHACGRLSLRPCRAATSSCPCTTVRPIG